MEFNKKLNLKQTTSGLGFYIFVSCVVLYVSSYAMAMTALFGNADYKSPTFDLLISAVSSILAMFITGLLYCALSKTRVNTILPVRKVKPSLLFKVVLIALAVSFLSNYITDALISNLSMFGYENNISMEYATKTPLENLLYVFSVAVMPAFVEEFMFRGIILNKLRQFGDGFAVLVSSILFGLIHGNLVQIPFAFVVGLALGFIVVKTNSIIPSMIVHFTVNATSVLVSIFEQSIDNNTINLIFSSFLLFILVGAIASAISLGMKKDFFKLSSSSLYPFKESIRCSFTSTGMIFAIIFILGETVFSIIAL